MSTEGVPFAMLCAWLEEKGYRAWQIGRLTRGYIEAVLSWPREKTGALKDLRAQQRKPTRAEVLRKHLFLCGYPQDRIEARVRELLAQEQAKAQKPGRVRGRKARAAQQRAQSRKPPVSDAPESPPPTAEGPRR